MKQLFLWGEEAPTSSWIGKRVLFHGKKQALVSKILAHTQQWGTLYELVVDGERFPHLAYEDEWKAIHENTMSPSPS